MAFSEDITPDTQDVQYESKRLFSTSLFMLTESPIQPIQNCLLVVESERTFANDDGFPSEIAGRRTHFL